MFFFFRLGRILARNRAQKWNPPRQAWRPVHVLVVAIIAVVVLVWVVVGISRHTAEVTPASLPAVTCSQLEPALHAGNVPQLLALTGNVPAAAGNVSAGTPASLPNDAGQLQYDSATDTYDVGPVLATDVQAMQADCGL